MQGRARPFQAIFRPLLSGSATTGSPAPATSALVIAVPAVSGPAKDSARKQSGRATG